MNANSSLSGILYLAVCSSIFISSAWAREFTDVTGRKINAEIINADTQNVVLKMGTKQFTVPVERLVEADQKFIEKWRVEEEKNKIPKLEVDVNSGKSNRSDRNDTFDDRKGAFKFSIKITNEEIHYDLRKAKAYLAVLGETADGTDVFGIMQKSEFNVDAAPGATFEWQGKPESFYFDDSEPSRWGVSYYGYVLVLKNESGKVIFTQVSPKRFEDFAEKIAGLKEGSAFDRNLKSKSGFRIYRNPN